MIAHVLGRPKREDQKKIEEATSNIGEALSLMISGNTDMAMNRFN